MICLQRGDSGGDPLLPNILMHFVRQLVRIDERCSISSPAAGAVRDLLRCCSGAFGSVLTLQYDGSPGEAEQTFPLWEMSRSREEQKTSIHPVDFVLLSVALLAASMTKRERTTTGRTKSAILQLDFCRN